MAKVLATFLSLKLAAIFYETIMKNTSLTRSKVLQYMASNYNFKGCGKLLGGGGKSTQEKVIKRRFRMW